MMLAKHAFFSSDFWEKGVNCFLNRLSANVRLEVKKGDRILRLVKGLDLSLYHVAPSFLMSQMIKISRVLGKSAKNRGN